MFEHIRFTQANGTIYLHKREERVILLHRENNDVVLMGRAPGRRGALASGTKRQKNALMVDSCGFGHTHERLHEDVLRARAPGDELLSVGALPVACGQYSRARGPWTGLKTVRYRPDRISLGVFGLSNPLAGSKGGRAPDLEVQRRVRAALPPMASARDGRSSATARTAHQRISGPPPSG